MGKLTHIQIANAKPEKEAYRLSDGEGLALEVTPKGSKLWRLRYRYDGKQQIKALGKFPLIGLAEARLKRDEVKKLLHEGKHPAREAKQQKLRATQNGENSFEAIATAWLAMKSKDLNAKYAKQTLARMQQHVFPHIGALPISDITIPNVVHVIDKIAAHGTIETANRMKQTIGQVFRYASQRGMCEHNPAADLRGILPSQEEKHHPCIAPEELPELLQAIESRNKDFTYYAIKLIMLTFVRTNELIGARWDEIDWHKKEWNIPKERMKMRRPHNVPLSRQALAHLKELQAITGNREFIFFSGAAKSKHMSNGAILMGLNRMGYKGRMTGHGFRTLASTILNERGYRPDVIERQLAHADRDAIRHAYNRAQYNEERIQLMQDYADILEAAIKNSNDLIRTLPFLEVVNGS